jgi:hypothetical protein
VSAPRYLLVLTPAPPPPEVSVTSLAAAANRLAWWVGALRRWRLLHALGAETSPGPAAVSGCLLVAASDLAAARVLAGTCPAGVLAEVTVLELEPEVDPGGP